MPDRFSRKEIRKSKEERRQAELATGGSVIGDAGDFLDFREGFRGNTQHKTFIDRGNASPGSGEWLKHDSAQGVVIDDETVDIWKGPDGFDYAVSGSGGQPRRVTFGNTADGYKWTFAK